jgi:membrane protease YdiL (CAAX protease family)
MSGTAKHPLRMFIILTYATFWILFSITGLLVFSESPQIYQTIMKNVCAWASTFVLLIFFKKFVPNESLSTFIKKQFTKISFLDFIIPMLIQVIIAILAIILVFTINRESFENIRFIQVFNILPLILINITSGPMGEELGWRGYALNEFQKKYNLFISSILIGVLWGLWHFPLWLVSGYIGIDLIIYAVSFMLGIISFSVFIAFFYNNKKNILVAVWTHFLFNILLQIVILEDIKFMVFISLLYLIVSCFIVITKRKIFFKKLITIASTWQAVRAGAVHVKRMLGKHKLIRVLNEY